MSLEEDSKTGDELLLRQVVLDELASLQNQACSDLIAAIQSLPNYSTKALLKLVTKVKGLAPSDATAPPRPDSKEPARASSVGGSAQWQRGVYLFSLEVTKCLVRRLKTLYLDELRKLDPHIEYWSRPAPFTVRFWKRLFGPRDQIGKPKHPEADVLNKLAIEEVSDTPVQLKKLRRLKRRYEKQLGRFHRYLYMLDGVQDLIREESLEPLMYAVKNLYRFLCKEWDERNQQPTLSWWDTLDRLEQSLKAVPALSTSFQVTLSELAAPSHLRRHWLKYLTLVSGLLVTSYTVYTKRRELVEWGDQSSKSLRIFFRDHIADPVANIYHSIFTTFRDRNTAASSRLALEQSRKSLQSMLEEFGRIDIAFLAAREGKTTDQILDELPTRAAEGDMTLVMEKYSSEIRRPIRNIVTGDLLRGLLIQVQKVKVDGEAAMVTLDQVLAQNEINFEILATIPAVLLFIGCILGTKRLLWWIFIRRNPKEVYAEIRKRLRQIQHRVMMTGTFRNSDEEDMNVGSLLVSLGYLEELIEKLDGEQGRLMLEDLNLLSQLSLTPWQKHLVLEQMYRSYPLLTHAQE